MGDLCGLWSTSCGQAVWPGARLTGQQAPGNYHGLQKFHTPFTVKAHTPQPLRILQTRGCYIPTTAAAHREGAQALPQRHSTFLLCTGCLPPTSIPQHPSQPQCSDTPLQDYNSLPPATHPQTTRPPKLRQGGGGGAGSMGGCVSLDAGPAARGRDPGIHSRSPLPPPVVPIPATVPDIDEPIVKQVLPDTRIRQPLSPLPANDENPAGYPPLKAKPTVTPPDHGAVGGTDPVTRSSPPGLPTPPVGSTLRSASARECPGDRSGMQQPEMMMMMTWGGGQGMLGRRARSLRDARTGEGPLLVPEDEKQRRTGGPGKETLENPLVSLECFIFL